MLKNLILATILLSLVSIYACKKECNNPTDPKCDNYDPCFGKSSVKADFIIEEEVGPVFVETDTIYAQNKVRFTPTVEYDSLKWLIGTEIVTDKVLIRKSFPENEWIKVRLVVYKQPNTTCFPNDNGIDTLTKLFYSASKDQLLFFGFFNGYNTDQPNDTFTVMTESFDSLWGKVLDIRNLPKGTIDKFSTNNASFGGRALYTESSNGGMQSRFALKATLIVINGKMTITYSYDDEAYKAWLESRTPGTSVRVSKTFIGKKL